MTRNDVIKDLQVRLERRLELHREAIGDEVDDDVIHGIGDAMEVVRKVCADALSGVPACGFDVTNCSGPCAQQGGCMVMRDQQIIDPKPGDAITLRELTGAVFQRAYDKREYRTRKHLTYADWTRDRIWADCMRKAFEAVVANR